MTAEFLIWFWLMVIIAAGVASYLVTSERGHDEGPHDDDDERGRW